MLAPRSTPTIALLTFHVKAGSRLAMRTGVPTAAAFTVGIGLSPDPNAALRLVATDLATTSGSFVMGALLAVVAAGMASWATPRVWHGVDGWVRHLPADWPAHRRALLGALTAAQLPIAMAWGALWLVAWGMGSDVEARRLLAMPVVLVGVSLTSVPTRRPLVVAVAGLLVVGLALFAGWSGLALAVVVGLAAERLILPPRGRTRRGVLWRSHVGAGLVPGVIAFRAVGRRLLNAYAPVLVTFGPAWLLVRNNPGVSYAAALRFAAGCTVALVVAGLARELITRRPPWRWARSLPWSAADRVRGDTLWLTGHAAVVLLAFGAVLSPRQALVTALVVPLISVRAAGALRKPRTDTHTDTHTVARLLGEGVFVAAWFSVTIWTAVPALLLVWPAWRDATGRDRNLDVSRWSPQAHLASGDPVSWRGP